MSFIFRDDVTCVSRFNIDCAANGRVCALARPCGAVSVQAVGTVCLFACGTVSVQAVGTACLFACGTVSVQAVCTVCLHVAQSACTRCCAPVLETPRTLGYYSQRLFFGNFAVIRGNMSVLVKTERKLAIRRYAGVCLQARWH